MMVQSLILYQFQVDEAGKTGILVESHRHPDGARQATRIRRHILEFQSCVSAIEKCEKRASSI